MRVRRNTRDFFKTRSHGTSFDSFLDLAVRFGVSTVFFEWFYRVYTRFDVIFARHYKSV